MRIKDFLAEIFVFLLSLAIRLPSLGWDIFNPDSWRWKARAYQFSTGLFGLDFAKTAQAPHPGVSLMWVSTFAIKVYNLANRLFRPEVEIESRGEVFVFHFAVKLALVLVISFLLALSFRLLKKLVGFWAALFSILILTLEPFFLAHTRIYHLDALLTMLMSVAILFLLSFSAEVENWKYLILSAVFSALAALTKSTALFLLPFSLLIISLIALRQPSRKLRFFLLNTCYFLLATAAAFVAAWPAMCVQPLKTLNLYLSGISGEGFGEHGQVMFGQVTAAPGPVFYPLSLAIRLSPWLLSSFSLGALYLLSDLLRKRKDFQKVVFKFVLLFILLYLVFITIPSKKLERYALPIYPFLSILAGFGLDRVGEELKSVIPKIRPLLIGAVFVLFLFSVSPLHPDYLAYYSPLVGGLRNGIWIIRPDWVIGAKKVGAYFNELPEADKIQILAPDSDQLQPFLKGQIRDTLHVEEVDRFDYVLLPVWSEKDELRGLEPEHVVEINSVPIYNIYRVSSTGWGVE